MLKKILYFIYSTLLLIVFFIIFDLTNFDNKYLNRNTIHIDVKNLSSKYTKQLFTKLRLYYLNTYKILNRESYDKRWGIENTDERNLLKKEILITSLKNNFSESLYSTSDYDVSNNWFRSHGNNFSTRFSSLKLINKSNANQIKLAWLYEPKNELDYVANVQANPIFYNGNIFTPNSQNEIISLDAKTGEEKWKFKVNEGIAAKRGLIIFDDDKKSRLFFTNNRGFLFSLDAKTGKNIKNFGNDGTVKIGVTPIPPVIYEDNLILVDTDSNLIALDLFSGKIRWKYKIKNEKKSLLFPNFPKGSPWGGFSLDYKRGLIFFTTGNPEYWHVGTDRPGDNLYANSIVAFDLKAKTIKWHFQEISHDLWNLDLAAAPILTTIKKNNKTIDVVVAVSKLGNTLVLDRESGKSLFDIKKVLAPTSNVPGERTSPYQIEISLPEPVCRNKLTKDELTNLTYVDKDKIHDVFENSEYGFPNPPKIGIKNINIAGCVRWAGASVDTENNILFVSTDQMPRLVSIIENKFWKGTYTHKWELFVDSKNFPAIKPPWGSIVALDLNVGKILWKVTFGEYSELTKLGIPKTGTYNRSGLTATKGNLIFASGTQDNKFVVLDSSNGKELWSYLMTHAGSAPPLTYEINEKQYIIVPAFENGGRKIYSFSLD